MPGRRTLLRPHLGEADHAAQLDGVDTAHALLAFDGLSVATLDGVPRSQRGQLVRVHARLGPAARTEVVVDVAEHEPPGLATATSTELRRRVQTHVASSGRARTTGLDLGGRHTSAAASRRSVPGRPNLVSRGPGRRHAARTVTLLRGATRAAGLHPPRLPALARGTATPAGTPGKGPICARAVAAAKAPTGPVG